MALINCPECNGSLSEKANICPHCGFPTKSEEETAEYEYQLTKYTYSKSDGASFLRAMAWFLWIGGLVVAIISSLGEEARYYSTRTTFDWATFFTVLISYAIYGGLAWSINLVLDDVHGIYTLLSSLQLTKTDKSSKKNLLF